MILFEYPPCSTCRNARKWLDAHKVAYTTRNIKEDRPSPEEIRGWLETSRLPIKRFFNTSGLVYKSLNLKDRLPSMSTDECIELLASDGMLVKRPLLVGENFVVMGFKEAEWEEILATHNPQSTN